MTRLTEQDKARNEQAIRAAMDRLLRGDLPPGGRCDLKTLATEAGVTRTGFYPKNNRDGTARPGPYQHLAEEFERRFARSSMPEWSPTRGRPRSNGSRLRSAHSKSASPAAIPPSRS
jgi:hypothetical protein